MLPLSISRAAYTRFKVKRVSIQLGVADVEKGKNTVHYVLQAFFGSLCQDAEDFVAGTPGARTEDALSYVQDTLNQLMADYEPSSWARGFAEFLGTNSSGRVVVKRDIRQLLAQSAAIGFTGGRPLTVGSRTRLLLEMAIVQSCGLMYASSLEELRPMDVVLSLGYGPRSLHNVPSLRTRASSTRDLLYPAILAEFLDPARVPTQNKLKATEPDPLAMTVDTRPLPDTVASAIVLAALTDAAHSIWKMVSEAATRAALIGATWIGPMQNPILSTTPNVATATFKSLYMIMQVGTRVTQTASSIQDYLTYERVAQFILDALNASWSPTKAIPLHEMWSQFFHSRRNYHPQDKTLPLWTYLSRDNPSSPFPKIAMAVQIDLNGPAAAGLPGSFLRTPAQAINSICTDRIEGVVHSIASLLKAIARDATFHTGEAEMPPGFRLVSSLTDEEMRVAAVCAAGRLHVDQHGTVYYDVTVDPQMDLRWVDENCGLQASTRGAYLTTDPFWVILLAKPDAGEVGDDSPESVEKGFYADSLIGRPQTVYNELLAAQNRQITLTDELTLAAKQVPLTYAGIAGLVGNADLHVFVPSALGRRVDAVAALASIPSQFIESPNHPAYLRQQQAAGLGAATGARPPMLSGVAYFQPVPGNANLHVVTRATAKLPARPELWAAMDARLASTIANHLTKPEFLDVFEKFMLVQGVQRRHITSEDHALRRAHNIVTFWRSTLSVIPGGAAFRPIFYAAEAFELEGHVARILLESNRA